MLPNILTSGDALLHKPGDGWLFFRNPLEVLSADRLEQVTTTIDRVEQLVEGRGLHAAGFIAYEAAPAFDAALKVRLSQSFPLVWFGLYKQPERLPNIPLPLEEDSLSRHAWTPDVNRQAYDGSIAQIKEHIACGDTYQVNYTYRLHAAWQGDPLAYFFRLARAQKAPYPALINTDRFTICSASPELFFSLDGERITSKPMKGTAPRGKTYAEDEEWHAWLKSSTKNQAENVMIVDMVRNDIGKIARAGSVQVPDLFTLEKYPTVWQMVSTVIGDTQASFGEILKALFPAASITGAPKARTMEIIAELESSPRQVYTGCIGLYSPGRKAQFNVAIRTVLIDNACGEAEYGVGGGVTWDSVDAAEFDESQTKARVLTAHLPYFSLLETMLWTPEDGYFLLERHLERLGNSAHYFSFPLDLVAIQSQLARLAETFGPLAMKVRLLVAEDGSIQAQADTLPAAGAARLLRVGLASSPIDSSDPFLYHKTTHRQVYEDALRSLSEYADENWDDVILWNERGELTESSRANLLVELDGALYTPPVECGLLPGTYRSFLLEQGRIKERVIRVEDLVDNPPVYLINSVRKQQAVQVGLSR